jgi:hypothetical protein
MTTDEQTSEKVWADLRRQCERIGYLTAYLAMAGICPRGKEACPLRTRRDPDKCSECWSQASEGATE